MKRVLVALLSAVALLATTACKKENKKADAAKAQQKADAKKADAKKADAKKADAKKADAKKADAKKVTKVKDVVCGMEEDMAKAKEKWVHFKHEGKDYYFCSKTCLEKFKKDPKKYLAHAHKKGEKDHKEHKK